MLKKTIDKLHMTYLDSLAKKQIQMERELVDKILSFDPGCTEFIVEDERSYPGHPAFIKSEYWKTMLKRYFLAGQKYCRKKQFWIHAVVLDGDRILLHNMPMRFWLLIRTGLSLNFVKKHG